MRTYSRLLAPHSFERKPQASTIPEFLTRRIRQLPLRLLPVCVAIAVSGCNWSTLVSQNSASDQGNSNSYAASTSADGRYIAFGSSSNNLVANDTNGKSDVFVRDTLLGVTTRVNITSAGEQTNVNSGSAVISADGRYVAFESEATNLVADDTNNASDIFLHDRETGVTTRVSVDSEGNEGNAFSRAPAISADGRYIAFSSNANNLAPGDTFPYALEDVFVHDRVTGSTTMISVPTASNVYGASPDISADGQYVAFISINLTITSDIVLDVYVNDRETGVTTLASVNSEGRSGANYSPSISADGRYVAFYSNGYLLPGNLNSLSQVYVKDLVTGSLTQANVDSSGNPGNLGSDYPDISADGRYVTFQSSAENLVAGDTNGRDDVFVHDRITGVTTRESVDAAGNEGYGYWGSRYPKMSADGRYVVFQTAADSVSGGTNGEEHIVMKALTHLTVTGVLPNKLPVGSTTPVTISGTNFLPGSMPKFDANVSNVVIVDEQTMTAEVIVPAGHATGASDVSVYLPGTGPGALAGSVYSCDDCVTFTAVPPGC